ncbi:50S ribosomal protein L25/general stress protein Ctc [Arthrobacter sp. LAPM80]|uniref:50S ribosomal protein L25/general stress protein Ctc n=1 Tax=Arthrobacter sp. LAPM80 TaxID=3141788 RepID=UPI00398AF347
MSDLNLTGEARNEFGKGAARRIRRAKQIPAVIYGHGVAPLHIVLPERETSRAIRSANALLNVTVDGVVHLALVKDVQKDPVLQIVEHIDLLTVQKGEKVIVDVRVVLVGEPAAAVVVNQEEMVVSVTADATNVPVSVEVSIAGRTAGQHIYATDLVLPANTELALEGVMLIAHLAEAAVAPEAVAE